MQINFLSEFCKQSEQTRLFTNTSKSNAIKVQNARRRVFNTKESERLKDVFLKEMTKYVTFEDCVVQREDLELMCFMECIEMRNCAVNIQVIDWLEFQNVTQLQLFRCSLENPRELSHLKQLRYLDLQGNKINSLQFAFGLFGLEVLNLRDNEIQDPDELIYFLYSQCLQKLVLTGNPMLHIMGFEEKLMFVLPLCVQDVHIERDMALLFENFAAYKELNPFSHEVMNRLQVAERLLKEDRKLRMQLKDPNWVPRGDPETLRRAALLRSQLIPEEYTKVPQDPKAQNLAVQQLQLQSQQMDLHARQLERENYQLKEQNAQLHALINDLKLESKMQLDQQAAQIASLHRLVQEMRLTRQYTQGDK